MENVVKRLLNDEKYNQAYTEYFHAVTMLGLYKELNIDANIFKDKLNKTICADSNLKLILDYLKSKLE